MSRLLTILYVVFCFDMGVFLFILPWTDLWAVNYFVHHYPWVEDVARNYVVRGTISGIGLADVWLAFYELWRLRGVLGIVHTRPTH